MDTLSEYSGVVITGAAGWLGRGVVDATLNGLPDCPALAMPQFAGKPIWLFDKEVIPPSANSNVIEVRGDICDRDDCYRLFAETPPGALVLHCAGLIHPRHTRQLMAVNARGCENLYTAAAAAGVARFVAVSSNSPCGCNRRRADRFDEESPYNPYLAYGRSKMAMEKFLRAQSSPAWTIIRAPWFYGARQPPRQSLFFEMIRDGKGPIVGDGDNLRAMAYIDNLAQGLLLAAASPRAAGQIYWIADEHPYTMNQIIDTIERLLESEFSARCKRRRLRLPGLAADVAYVCDWALQAVGLYHQKIHVLSEMNKTIACDIRKAKDELGYAPTVGLEEGMRRSIADAFGLTPKIE